MRKNAQKKQEEVLEFKHLDEICNIFETCFSTDYLEDLAKETRFIQRSRTINASAFAKSLIFNELDQYQLSLLNLKLDLQFHFECKVSREAIHKRFTPQAVVFMKSLLAKLIDFRLQVEDSIPISAQTFNRICLKDSTKFLIPKNLADSYPGINGFHKENALMNIQYEYDLLSGNWSCLDFTKATRNDQKDTSETIDRIQKGDLHIRDLGYVTMYILNVL